MGKRILNPDSKLLWIAGGALVLGGTYWYLNRKKKEKEESAKKAKEPTNVKIVATQAEAEELKDKPNEAPSVLVWMKQSVFEPVLAHVQGVATANGAITFYVLPETVQPLIAEFPELVSMIWAGRDGQRRFETAIEGVAPVEEVKAAIDEAVTEVLTPRRLGDYEEAPSVGDLMDVR